MISDFCKNIDQVGLRIDAIHLAGLGDGVDTCGASAAGVGATEEIVLPSQKRELRASQSAGAVDCAAGRLKLLLDNRI
jgi:hypothetical protein